MQNVLEQLEIVCARTHIHNTQHTTHNTQHTTHITHTVLHMYIRTYSVRTFLLCGDTASLSLSLDYGSSLCPPVTHCALFRGHNIYSVPSPRHIIEDESLLNDHDISVIINCYYIHTAEEENELLRLAAAHRCHYISVYKRPQSNKKDEVCMNVCIYMYVCMYVCVDVCVCVYVYVYVYMCMCMCIYAYVKTIYCNIFYIGFKTRNKNTLLRTFVFMTRIGGCY